MGVNSMDPQAIFRTWRARITAYDVVRVAAAVVLLTAAGLKAHQLATSPVLGDGFLDSRWILIATVEFEIFFGLWLLANILPVWTRRAAIALFALFAAVSLYKALTGHASCGCFGRVEVNPWWTFGLDVGIVSVLWRWRPENSPQPVEDVDKTDHNAQPAPSLGVRAFAVGAIWLIIGVPTAAALGGAHVWDSAEMELAFAEDTVAILEPQKLVGKRFPLLQFVEDRPDSVSPQNYHMRGRLTQGEWTVILYRDGCARCARMMPEWRAKLTKWQGNAARNGGHEVARCVGMIEVPPYGNAKGHGLCSGWHFGRLRDSRQWFVETPLVLRLNQGRVESIVFSGEEKL